MKCVTFLIIRSWMHNKFMTNLSKKNMESKQTYSYPHPPSTPDTELEAKLSLVCPRDDWRSWLGPVIAKQLEMEARCRAASALMWPNVCHDQTLNILPCRQTNVK